jgi:glycine betaine/proline transport system substrate-binding protein
MKLVARLKASAIATALAALKPVLRAAAQAGRRASLCASLCAGLGAGLGASAPLAAQAAAEPSSCQNVRFADVGWTDIAATTGLASVVLESLGYKPSVMQTMLPVTFAGLKSKHIDAFLGYWKPSMTPMLEPFLRMWNVEVLDRPNLVGAKYTLAVPDYLYQQGLRSFKDIARFSKQLGGQIYGIEPGNDGNALIQGMIQKNLFGLQSFKLVESSEEGMLASVKQAVAAQQPIVFLGWEPHPMNLQFKLRYLEGGDEVFGANFGEAKVYTAVGTDYLQRCPNVGTFLRNLQFDPAIENQVMAGILAKERPTEVGRSWLKQNPEVLSRWLAGVTTFKGEPALPSVRKALGL